MDHKLNSAFATGVRPGPVVRMWALLASIMDGFRRLTAIQFDTPWRETNSNCC